MTKIPYLGFASKSTNNSVTIVFLWIFSINIIMRVYKGYHFQISLGVKLVKLLEVTFGLSYWENLWETKEK